MLNYLRLSAVGLLWCTALLGDTTTVSSIRISTVPSGAKFYVDGQIYFAPQVFLWPQGSKHTVQFPTDVDNAVNTNCQISNDLNYKYCFNNWTESTGTLQTGTFHDLTITADPSITWLQANLTPYYRLSILFGTFPTLSSSTCEAPGNAPQDVLRPGLVYIGGACFQTSANTWVAGSTALTLNAFPYPGFIFNGWNFNGHIYSSSLASYTMTGPATLNVDFELGKRVQFVTNPLGMKLLIDHTQIPTNADQSLNYLTANFPACGTTLELPPAPPITIPALCFGQFDFLPGSQHTVGAVTPQQDSTSKYWVFDKFSDGLANNSVYTADSNTSVPDIVVANFVPGVQATFVTVPSALQLNIDGRTNWPSYAFVWASNSSHTVSAPASQTDANGRVWTFQSWSNGGAATQTLTMDPAQTGLKMIATYTALGQLTVLTNPTGLKLQVDGADCTTPCTVNRAGGTSVTITAPASVPIDDNSRLDFLGWGDGGTPARTFTVPAGTQTVYANYGYSYRLSLASNPSGGADFQLSPASADLFYGSGTQVTVAATARAGFRFRRWSGDLSGVYNVGQLTVSGPRSVVAMLDQVPYIAPAGVQNAAGTTPDGSVAPGSIISIYGQSLAPQLVVNTQNPLPQTLGDVVVLVGDRMLPLMFVSPAQINAQLPSDLVDGTYTVTVKWTGQPDVTATFTVARDAPGLFVNVADSLSYLSALHEDGTPITSASPALRGELITAYGTGFGPYSRTMIDGFSASDWSVTVADAVEVDAGGVAIQPEWTGAVPGTAGLVATRFRIPAGATLASGELIVKVNGKASNTTILPVQ